MAKQTPLIDGNNLRIEKPKVRKQIRCNKCKQDSGYTNEDFMHVNLDRDIKCKNCKKTCIRLLCSKKSHITMKDIADSNEKSGTKIESDNLMDDDY